ncbi:MAG: signal peptidase I [Verrucomicrobiota bacterium]|jgi:signal peptidase I
MNFNSIFRWFLSASVRHASDMRKHVQRLLNAQRDILSPQAIEALETALRQTRAVLASGAPRQALQKQMEELEKTANKWIKPYPNAEWRENVEVFLVAIVVAMGIRTFLLQPFKIPTGSMQPTLYGVTTEDLRFDPGFKMPNPLLRVWAAMVDGTIYHQVIAPEDGQVVRVGPLDHFLRFFNMQTIWVRYAGRDSEVPLTIWLGPDDNLDRRAGFDRQTSFRKGEPIVSFEETTGDHLFVDRVTYNFRQPQRGEIVVFKTKGIAGLQNQDQFYIKRLIGLPGDAVSIGEDRHARVNGRRLDASMPHFENVYGFDPATVPRDSHYSGHVLDSRSTIRSPEDTIHARVNEVPPEGYVVFGDNTVNSLDSRFWGALPQRNVIGKSFFVYWPISSRFGWGQQ